MSPYQSSFAVPPPATKASLLLAKPGRPVIALVIASANSCVAVRTLPLKLWLNSVWPECLSTSDPETPPASAVPVAWYSPLAGRAGDKLARALQVVAEDLRRRARRAAVQGNTHARQGGDADIDLRMQDRRGAEA